MKKLTLTLLAASLLSCGLITAEDWPQFRGLNSTAIAKFNVPTAWPKELKKVWSEKVGDGVSCPVLVGDKVYIHARQGADEIIRCLNAADGKELWNDKVTAKGADGPAQGFAGPRCTPAIADGLMVTMGVRGMITCYEAASGKKLWQKEDPVGKLPRFYTSSSPIIVDGTVVLQCGGEEKGAIYAFDLKSGNEKWKFDAETTAYASLVLANVSGSKLIIAETNKNIVGLNPASGKQLFTTPFAIEGRGRGYNSSTPVVHEDMLIFGGSSRGTKAFKIAKTGEGFELKPLWTNNDHSVIYNTPVVQNGKVYSMSQGDEIFSINLSDGKTGWMKPFPGAAPATPPAEVKTGEAKGPPGKGQGRGRGQAGYGTLIGTGSVLFAMTPKSEMVVFTDKEGYTELAKYKVGVSDTFAYPIITDKRIFIKDKENLTLWTVE